MSPGNQFVFPIYLGKSDHKSPSKFKRFIRKNIFRLVFVSLVLPLLAGAGVALYRNPRMLVSLNWQTILLTSAALFIASIITGIAVFRFIRLKELMTIPTAVKVKSMPVKKLVAQKKVKQPIEYKNVIIDAEMWTKDRNQSTENGRYQIGFLPEEFSADDVLVFSLQYDAQSTEI